MWKALVMLGACGALASAPAACGSDEGQPKAAGGDSVSASQNGQARSSKTAIKMMNTRYGRMLFDGTGRALYLFTRENSSRARCYGDCAVAWPPFLARGSLTAGSGAKVRLLGTTRRRDGRRQVTYRGHPLYYYVSDTKPGQVTCQNVDEFGGTWLVVAPNGRAITAPR
jgi:predicted lipoprotein with Yx(FWY)xxD motif